MKILKYAARTGIVLLFTVILILTALLGMIWILSKGPSPEISRLFVLTMNETSAAKFVPYIFLSKDAVNEIISSDNSGVQSDETVDVSLIMIPQKEKEPVTEPETQNPGNYEIPPEITYNKDSTEETAPPEIEETTPAEADAEKDGDGIEIIYISGKTYKGVMMLVRDPSRVFIGIPPNGYGSGKYGLSVSNMIAHYGAAAGINGGGFNDPNGTGTGGIPDGIVIYDGELMWGDRNTAYSIVGFDENHILHVGNISAARASELNIKYATCFGPALIINEKACNEKYPLGGGLNPRTAVGQKADGTIMLLVVNGRQIDSIGASYDDLIDIFLKHGAVNAGNLDGGSSSLMIYNGEYLNASAYIFGERTVPNAVLVK